MSPLNVPLPAQAKAVLAGTIAGLSALLPLMPDGFQWSDLVATLLAAAIGYGAVFSNLDAVFSLPKKWESNNVNDYTTFYRAKFRDPQPNESTIVSIDWARDEDYTWVDCFSKDTMEQLGFLWMRKLPYYEQLPHVQAFIEWAKNPSIWADARDGGGFGPRKISIATIVAQMERGDLRADIPPALMSLLERIILGNEFAWESCRTKPERETVFQSIRLALDFAHWSFCRRESVVGGEKAKAELIERWPVAGEWFRVGKLRLATHQARAIARPRRTSAT